MESFERFHNQRNNEPRQLVDINSIVEPCPRIQQSDILALKEPSHEGGDPSFRFETATLGKRNANTGKRSAVTAKVRSTNSLLAP